MIEKIEKALRDGMEGVTPGPWRMDVPDRGYCSNYLLTDAPELAPDEQQRWKHYIADFDNCARGEIDARYVVAAQPENIRALLAELDRLRGGEPDDIRALGWAVAVHNDYRLNGEPHTFWLFTKDGRAVKGEGLTDTDALNEVRRALSIRTQEGRADG